MRICVFYTSPKLGDIILQLPFIKAISDNYKTKVTICINKHVNIKKLLEMQSYIDTVIENPFRRGKFFTLTKEDLKYNYTSQSMKCLEKLTIPGNINYNFLALDKNEKNIFEIKYKNLPKPWVCFGVDSTEVNRIWPQMSFAKLADNLFENNLAKTIFVINYENHKKYFDEISKNSKYQNQLVNCKLLDRSQIIHLIDMCAYFVGIDSGPSCVSGALNKKTFCIIGPTDATLPRFISMKKITSDNYDKGREVGIKRCGDNFAQDDSEVKTISVSKVFDTIVTNL